MVNEKSIGKKVWVLNENTNGNFVINKNKVFTIVAIKPYNEVDNYCNHIVVKAEDGEEKEVREYHAVFIPNDALQGDEQISQFLNDNACYHDGVYTNTEGSTSVEIFWGDWKHSFIWLDTLMSYLGYDFDNEEVTEENGSDCYSAIHYFHKVA